MMLNMVFMVAQGAWIGLMIWIIRASVQRS